jgi:hypothetical protein
MYSIFYFTAEINLAIKTDANVFVYTAAKFVGGYIHDGIRHSAASGSNSGDVIGFW